MSECFRKPVVSSGDLENRKLAQPDRITGLAWQAADEEDATSLARKEACVAMGVSD